MKKIVIPVMLIFVLSLTSCGKKDNWVKVSPSPSSDIISAENSDDIISESEQSEDMRQDEAGDNAGQDTPESIYIINGTQMELYSIYISENTDGNVGENIIEGSPLATGEEIELPYINAANRSLNIIIEDMGGVRYSTPLNLADGIYVELRLNGGSLEAIVQ